MSFSLTSVAAAVASVYGEAETVVAAGEAVVAAFGVIKGYVVQLMSVAETAYSEQSGSGATKLAAVIAAVKAVAAQLGVDWSAGLEAAVASFIATAKSAYNAANAAVTTVTETVAAA